MSYINFVENTGLCFHDNQNRDFLIKTNNLKTTDINVFRDVAECNSIQCSFYLYELYDDETVKKDLTPYLVEDGQLNINYEVGIRRKLNITIFNDENWLPTPENGFMWKGSKFKLEIGVKTTLAEYMYPAGVFVLNDFEMSHSNIKNTISLSLVDKFGAIDGTVGGKISEAIYIPRGSNILSMIRSLLKHEKIDGLAYDTKSVLFPLKLYDATTPFTITKSADSDVSIGGIIKELAQIVNLEVFYDEYGRMCFEEMRENIVKNTKPSIWAFSDEDNNYNIPVLKTDLQAVSNVIIVQGANINGNIINAIAKNSNPKSPTNISIFEPTPYRIVDENIADIESANLRASYELYKSSLMPLSMSFNTIIIPTLNVNEVVTISDNYYNFKNTRFLVNSITIPIKGTSKITLGITNLEEVAFDGRKIS